MDDYLASRAPQFDEGLCQWLRIPSVSADPERRGAMQEAAAWLARHFEALRFATEVIPTSGHPLVYAESPPVPGAPTVLVYGHYDVQPPDPLELWTTPPFEPTVRDGKVFARGASDDKGQVLTHVYSAAALIETEGRMPVNLKYIVEGEEEVGSQGLEEFIAAHADRLACQCVVISDGSQFGPGQPAITYGLRGIAYFEVILQGPNRDLHSGTFGGSVTNPANALAAMLAALIDARGRIQVPGFYDDVVPLTERERRQFAELGFDEGRYLQQIGVTGAAGEEGYTLLERRWARPTCDINGLTSGYQGQGAKTVLPAAASAKLSFRLVPNQDPAKIAASLDGFLTKLCPPGIQLKLVAHHNSPGVLVPLDSPYIQAAARAIQRAFGRPPVYTREGGSIPIVSLFRQTLGADVLLLGWGQEDDNLHSPNEKFSLADFHRGIAASAALWKEIGQLKS